MIDYVFERFKVLDKITQERFGAKTKLELYADSSGQLECECFNYKRKGRRFFFDAKFDSLIEAYGIINGLIKKHDLIRKFKR